MASVMRLDIVFILICLFCIAHGGTLRGATRKGASSLGEYAQQIPTGGRDFSGKRRVMPCLSEVVPAEARQFYQSLTSEDKAVLRSVLNKSSSYTNVSQVLNDLKNGSSVLYNKAVDVVSSFRETIASLSEPSRKFVDDTASQIQKALGEEFSIAKVQAEAQAIVDRYSALNVSTKEELKNAFPMVATVVYNNVFQMLASGLLGLTASQQQEGGGAHVQGGDNAEETVPPPIRANN